MRTDPRFFFGLSHTGPHRHRPGCQALAYGPLSQGLAPGLGPGYPLDQVHKSLLVFFLIEIFEPHFVWPLTKDKFALGDPTRDI